MSAAAAQAAAAGLRTALLDHGVRAVSIELQPGVATSGWGVAPFKRGLGHHIVSRPAQGQTPGLALVKRGRPDLGGPLCNGYGGFDLVARIITLGWANHPGAGGPWSVPGWGTVPRDNGRPYIFGWEFEGGLEPYTDAMHEFMARCGAGTLDWLGTLPGNPGPAPLQCWDEHAGWAPGRKVDRLGYTTASGRIRIAAVRGATAQEDDMPHSRDDIKQMLREVLDEPVKRQGVDPKRYAGPDTSRTAVLQNSDARFDALPGQVADAVFARQFDRKGELATAQWGPGSKTSLGGLIEWNDDANLQLGSKIAQAVTAGDPTAIAGALTAALPAELARQVVAEVGKQLAT